MVSSSWRRISDENQCGSQGLHGIKESERDCEGAIWRPGRSCWFEATGEGQEGGCQAVEEGSACECEERIASKAKGSPLVLLCERSLSLFRFQKAVDRLKERLYEQLFVARYDYGDQRVWVEARPVQHDLENPASSRVRGAHMNFTSYDF
jgi:hypothetical protein